MQSMRLSNILVLKKWMCFDMVESLEIGCRHRSGGTMRSTLFFGIATSQILIDNIAIDIHPYDVEAWSFVDGIE